MRTRSSVSLDLLVSAALALTLAIGGCGPDRGRRGGAAGGGGGGGVAGGGGGAAGGGGGGGGAAGGGGGGEAQRLDSDVAVDGDRGRDTVVAADPDDFPTIESESHRAAVQFGPGSLDEDAIITVIGRPLSDFANTDDIIDGVYDFLPHDLVLKRAVRITLPLNGYAADGADLSLVRWDSPGVGWVVVEAEPVVTAGLDSASAQVDKLGVYGLRAPAGLSALIAAGDDTEDVGGNEVVCPAPRDEVAIGGQVGQRFPDPNLRNGEGKGERLYGLCGNQAILIVSSAFWCGSCRAEFQQLLNLAPLWRERGGAIYYTMFENEARQPPTDAELLAWEAQATPDGGERLFRVLKDPQIIPSLYRGEYGALPFNAVLDERMIVRWYKAGANLSEVISEMEKLMD